jgi:hypothetical protein
MLTTKRPHKPRPATMAHLNELLDEALEETFPASDPIAIAVELGSAEPKTAQAESCGCLDALATDSQRLTD